MKKVQPMEVTINDAKLVLAEGDITREDSDAIVNAANSRLIPGGGVDGAIHRAGGKAIAAACREIGGCPTGRAVITEGGALKARYVIHAVGPVYRDGAHDEANLLKSAYRESLKLAAEKGLTSISFPAISAGVYGYPPQEAATIALKTVIDFLNKNNQLKMVQFILFGRTMYDIFTVQLSKLISH